MIEKRTSSAMDRALRGLPDDVRASLLRYATENGITADDRDWVLVGLVGLAQRTPQDMRMAGDQVVQAIDAQLANARDAADAVREAAVADVSAVIADAAAEFVRTHGTRLTWNDRLKWLSVLLAVNVIVIGTITFLLGACC